MENDDQTKATCDYPVYWDKDILYEDDLPQGYVYCGAPASYLTREEHGLCPYHNDQEWTERKLDDWLRALKANRTLP